MSQRIGWYLIAALYLLVRFQNLPGVLTEHGIELNDTDPYYRLHRIERIVQGEITYPLHDPDLSFPRGMEVPWPTGLDYVFALPLKLFHVVDRNKIEMFCALAIPFLSLPILWGVGYVAHVTAGPVAALASGFLISLLPSAAYSSAVGRLDHHFLEVMLTVLALAMLVMIKKHPFRSWLGLFLILGLGPSFWPQAWIVGAFVWLSVLMERDYDLREKAIPFFFASSFLSMGTLMLSSRFQTGYLSIFGFSWWPTLLYGCLGASIIVFQMLHSRRFDWKRYIVYVAYLGAVMIFLFIKDGAHYLSTTTSQALNAIAPESGILSTTSEALPTVFIPILRWPDLGLIPFVLAWIWFSLQAFRRERWGLIGFFIGPLIMCAMQARFVQLASPVMVLGTVYLLRDLSHRLAPDPKSAQILMGMLVVGVSIPSLPEFGRTTRGNQHPLYLATRHVAHFIHNRDEKFQIAKKDRGIASHWDVGHWLLYYADTPVVAHPFQDAPAIDTLALFCSEEKNALADYVKKYPIRYLLLETPTARVNRWLEAVNKDPAHYFNAALQPDTSYAEKVKPRFYNLLLARFFMGGGIGLDGQHDPHWRLIYMSPFAYYGKEGPPAQKLYERVPGARLRARTNRGPLILMAKVETLEGYIYYRRKPEVKGNMVYEWPIPYGKSNSGGVRFENELYFETAKGKTFQFTGANITNDDIMRGRLIDLGTIR